MSVKIKEHASDDGETLYEINIREGDQIILNGIHVVLHAQDQNLMDGFDDDESELFEDYSHELCFVAYKDQSFADEVAEDEKESD